MSSEAPVEPAASASRRFSPKLLIVAGASAVLLLAAAGGTAVWLWPKSSSAAEAKAARLAARRAAQAASAASAAPLATAASAAGSAAAEPPVAIAAGSLVAIASAPSLAIEADVPPSDPALPTVAEAPLDRLQRRLGEVLGPKGAIEPARAGELRVLTRSSSVAWVRHADTVAPAPTAVAPPAAGDAQAPTPSGPWSHAGTTGPQAWGRLKPEYSLCAKGQRQSPIDIRDGIALDLEPLQIDYKPSGFGVIDTGHTVQVNLAPGNAIEVNGRRYALQQFHFHRPSEARINGRQFEMDVQLVHRDAEGRTAVLAVLLERGSAQPLLQTVWNHLPLEKQEENAARTLIDPAQLLPSDGRYYTFMGSLTTPPCSEGVLWLVMQQPLQVSAQQIDIFARLYPMNARPIQRAAGRMIKQSN
jgi:carbonic anhydrase